jgi:lipoyl synthase
VTFKRLINNSLIDKLIIMSMMEPDLNLKRKPDWLKVRLPRGKAFQQLKATRQTLGLATVCEEARCPNLAECWAGGTATFMILGDICTRGCRFCAVSTGNPNGWVDQEEPHKLAHAIQQAGWRYVVLTTVDRDDLPDGGAAHMAACITAIKQAVPHILVEVLIGDYQGSMSALNTVLAARPHVLAHNLETVDRLTPVVRDRRAGYQQSLTVLRQVKPLSAQLGVTILTKSSLMLGLGETDTELQQAMTDLRHAHVDVLTLGQYLQPSAKHLPVHRFVTPQAFQQWQHVAETTHGFLYCASGPLVRSSYKAGEYFMEQLVKARGYAADGHNAPLAEYSDYRAHVSST